MNNGLLLWADDEMELLRAHLLFLEKKGYEVVTVTNGNDAIEECKKRTFDLVLLDEMMPGLSGLETLQRIKEITPQVPIVMVTKSEEEDIMNQAIGQQIADYLIKPVNPNQILLSLKKNIHRKEIVTETVQTNYQQQFQQLSMQIMDCRTWQEWADISLGTGVERYRFSDDRDAGHAERGGQPWFLQVYQAELHGLDGKV